MAPGELYHESAGEGKPVSSCIPGSQTAGSGTPMAVICTAIPPDSLRPARVWPLANRRPARDIRARRRRAARPARDRAGGARWVLAKPKLPLSGRVAIELALARSDLVRAL